MSHPAWGYYGGMKEKPPELYGININELARICGVSLKTAARWKDGTTCPPPTAIMILKRDLGCFAKEWSGWTVNGGDLVSPSGWCVNRNDALTVPLMHGQISALRAEIAQLKDGDGLEEQPKPGELPEILTA
jgi:hypothetical protein